ncbi:hypothetical protein O988_06789 [Pseudogymnoascus sp. VKM F-3808]|nr:hypothetical protein O988_06789 [Pseudogymnoascus sp. VKM F-3808]
MRTSFTALFGLVGVAFAAPATLGGSGIACLKAPYQMRQCCPAKGPCNFRAIPQNPFNEDALKAFCRDQERVASCCNGSLGGEHLPCEPVL